MAMKSPPGSNSPLAECRNQLHIGPRTRVFGDGASGLSFWKIMAALSVLVKRDFIGIGGGRGGAQGAGAGPTRRS